MDKQQMIELLAERVMGWQRDDSPFGSFWVDPSSGEYVRHVGEQDWNPLENIADAWMVVDEIHRRMDAQTGSNNQGLVESVNTLTLTYTGSSWAAAFCCGIEEDGEWYEHADDYPCGAEADTECMAICLAALKAAGVEVSE